jgi:Inner membrane component of T3SS, cytoplasmic domain
MSFRLFVYYCALIGGWAAFVGWMLGTLVAPRDPHSLLSRNGIIGMFLGLVIAMGLGLVDALWSLSWRQFGQVSLRVGVALIIGAIGGFLGGIVGQLLFESIGLNVFFIVGWALVGVLCGASVGMFEFLASVLRKKDRRGARSKLIKCLLGGSLGGVTGGALALYLRAGLARLLTERDETLLFPTAAGFVALGTCIGLLVGLAQVILKEAWVRVESGFRPGREMILAKETTSIGRGEGTDLPLFGDNGVEKLHATIVQDGSAYFLEDNATPGGTFVNDQKVNGRTPLKSGDLIRVGKSVLRFSERQK